MAPQLIRSAVYCGVMVSRNSVARRQAELVQFPQQFPRQAQAVVDAEAAVHARIVDQSLPAHGGARLLEIHPHHDQQVVGETLRLFLQLACVFHGGVEVVDRARTDHHHQAVIGAVQDAMQGLARLIGGLRRRIGGREIRAGYGPGAKAP